MTSGKPVALITGASKGIGKAIALRLAQDGYRILINFRSNEEIAKHLKAEIEWMGGEAELVQGDVSLAEDCQQIFERAISLYGQVDVLVNNAGITRDNLIMRMKEEDFDAVMDANLKSVFLMSKAFARYFMKRKSGRIISISSIVGLAGNAGQANYAASKAGIIGLTKSLAKELGSRNVLVNAVAPGFIVSDMTEKLTPQLQDEYTKLIPLQRFGQVEDVANAVAFLASDQAKYITGQVISVDGGLNM